MTYPSPRDVVLTVLEDCEVTARDITLEDLASEILDTIERYYIVD